MKRPGATGTSYKQMVGTGQVKVGTDHDHRERHFRLWVGLKHLEKLKLP